MLTHISFPDYYWGMSIAGQDLLYEQSEPTLRPVSTLSPNCRFDIVAQGFGCNGTIVTKPEEVEVEAKKMIEGATQQQKPGLVNLIVSRQPVTATTKAMVGKTDEEGMIVVPYYDNVPRAYYKEKGSNGSNGTNGH
jgi:thiamine pyrophosphate-dependent acetolactate synthase large subunit-like protein